MAKVRYAKGPITYLYDADDLSTKRKQVLWGDWLRVTDDINDDWSKVLWGGDTLAVRKEDYQDERLLELIFLDVGQGDGCILTSPMVGPKEKIMIVDAGLHDNMYGYLQYRFRDFKKKFKFHAAVVTHPDSDHYRGFQPVFDHPNILFKNVYHNGLMERTGDDPLGAVEDGFLTDIKASKTAARDLYSDDTVRGAKWYPELIWTALNSDRFENISMLSTHHGDKHNNQTWMPGFSPADNAEFTIEVLGPVVERAPNGKRGLRTFGRSLSSTAMDVGKTKNGHSIILRIQYRDFSILLGGDLNTPAEHFLMRHYGNNGDAPQTLAQTDAMIEQAAQRFGVDLMKSCHHGAADVTDEFLDATHPAAYVVSSGDNESHVHPRPDLLGLLGKKGRGHRPLVLCTEILRSTNEKTDQSLKKKLKKLTKKIDNETDPVEKQTLQQQHDALLDEVFKRNVGVYGAINLRTDGNKAIIAFRLEKPGKVRRWFYYELEKDHDGEFQIKTRNGGH